MRKVWLIWATEFSQNNLKTCMMDWKDQLLYLFLQEFCCHFMQAVKCGTSVGLLIPALHHYLVTKEWQDWHYYESYLGNKRLFPCFHRYSQVCFYSFLEFSQPFTIIKWKKWKEFFYFFYKINAHRVMVNECQPIGVRVVILLIL